MTQQAQIIVLSDSVELSMPTTELPVSGERTFHAEEELEAAGVGTGPTGPASSAGGNAGTNSKQKDLEEPLCPDNKTGYGAIHTSAPRMYDPDATLSISKDVAGGYLVLLSGGAFTGNAGKSRLLSLRSGKRSKQRKCCHRFRNSAVDGANSQHSSDEELTSSTANTRIPDDAIQLAFMSLTDGNAIDTVFGVESRGGIKRAKETSKFAYDAAREAKEALREASYTSQAIPRLAVEAYELCFEVVIDYNRKREKLGFGFGFFTQCYQRDVIRGEAEEGLEEAFAMLRDAVEAAT
eukprot:CAMPEP_0181023976 /NCGR_PEP_ID=MMETSP1070-20121207/2329_1 /TAXON_ID=265543 /ORGANISM="Minutocellus polymorphus, Strain NH13" /LENGTH=293 /DNA_ID=CAMNT_0023101009 /DNA_START=260 /DNA_END=1141 /DNA_ORIENTATION=+